MPWTDSALPEEGWTVRLTYFKGTGKYYTEGSYLSRIPLMEGVWDEVRMLKRELRLPGLVEGAGDDFYILVEIPNHPHNHPRLITP
jgi:hypothetical protein